MSPLEPHPRTAHALALTVGLTTIALSHAAADSSVEWDQTRVAGIANKLAKAADDLYDAEYKAPHDYPGAISRAASQYDLMDRLRRLRSETRHLSKALTKGASAKSTIGSVRHIKELDDDLAEYGRRMPFVKPVLGLISTLEDLLGQLTPYYGLDS
jgi:hypothetical protein